MHRVPILGLTLSLLLPPTVVSAGAVEPCDVANGVRNCGFEAATVDPWRSTIDPQVVRSEADAFSGSASAEQLSHFNSFNETHIFQVEQTNIRVAPNGLYDVSATFKLVEGGVPECRLQFGVWERCPVFESDFVYGASAPFIVPVTDAWTRSARQVFNPPGATCARVIADCFRGPAPFVARFDEVLVKELRVDARVAHVTGLAAGDRLGAAVATDGNLVVAGLPDASGGKVVAFRIAGTELVDETFVVPKSRGIDTLRYGASLALQGRFLLVGAPTFLPVRGTDGLGAILFERQDDGSWTQVTGLAPVGGGSTGDLFGLAVAIDGDRVWVGAPGDDEARGAVYTYRIDGATVREAERIVPVERIRGAAFGASLAVEDGRVVVGAPGIIADRAGEVVLFEAGDGAFRQFEETGRLSAPIPAPSDDFGLSLALDRGVLLVGAPGSAGSSSGEGAAYLYALPGRNLLGSLVPPVVESDAFFGASVAFFSGGPTVGAPGLADGGGLFRFSRQDRTFLESYGPRDDEDTLGGALSGSERNLLAGAPGSDASRGSLRLIRPRGALFMDDFEQ